MEYVILIGDNNRELIDSVREFLATGWEPLGGVCFKFDKVESLSLDGKWNSYPRQVVCQAMIRTPIREYKKKYTLGQIVVAVASTFVGAMLGNVFFNLWRG